MQMDQRYIDAADAMLKSEEAEKLREKRRKGKISAQRYSDKMTELLLMSAASVVVQIAREAADKAVPQKD